MCKPLRFAAGRVLPLPAWGVPAGLQPATVPPPPIHVVSSDGFVEYRAGTRPLLPSVSHWPGSSGRPARPQAPGQYAQRAALLAYFGETHLPSRLSERR